MSECHRKAELNAHTDRYYHVKFPFLNNQVDILSVIHTSTYVIGLAGSYTRSEKLIKYYKYLLYFDVISRPFVVAELMLRASSNWSEISMQKRTDAPESFEQDTKFVLTVFAVLQCAYHGILYIKKIYSANVALRYQKSLFLSGGNYEAK
ncbi:hypothetical protein MBANPS3_008247 [Mucor bainieri]